MAVHAMTRLTSACPKEERLNDPQQGLKIAAECAQMSHVINRIPRRQFFGLKTDEHEMP